MRLLIALIAFTIIVTFSTWTPDTASAQDNSQSSNTSASSLAAKRELAISKLEEAIEYEMSSKNMPTFAISLVDGNSVVVQKGFGYSDTAKSVKATEHTRFRVGSVSKLFTDIALMQLVESGKIDLDAPAETYLPTFRPKTPTQEPITLRLLTSHRAGIVREPPVGHYFDPTNPSLAETVASLNQTELTYAPSTRTKYSNAGIAVVGQAIEAVSGDNHPDRIRKAIFDPLGMKESSFAPDEDANKLQATSWMRTYDGRRFESPTFLLGTGPAGNMVSSVSDLAIFMNHCLNALAATGNDATVSLHATAPILSNKSWHEMVTPQTDRQSKPLAYGIGFRVQKLDGFTKIGHGGAVYGFSTQVEMLPDRELGVAAISTLDSSNAVVSRIADYSLRLWIALSDDKPLPDYERTVPIPPERGDTLTGVYVQPNGTNWARILKIGSEYYLRHGTYQLALRANAKTGAIVVDDLLGFGTTVTPTATASDKATAISIGGIPYERDDRPPAKQIPDSWKGLIGEYGWDHDVLYILEDRGQLYALIEWFDYYPLSEISPNEFCFPDYGLYQGERLIFERSAAGEATAVVAAQVRFERREVGTQHGITFKITPQKPIVELRSDAMASKPPRESTDKRPNQLTEITSLIPDVRLDIRYASDNNFVGTPFYSQPRAFLQRPAAESLANVQNRLKGLGYSLLIHDAYRPWYVTKMFWDATPPSMRQFVANPANGSRHNRGCAVDLTLIEVDSGKPVEMVSGYDEFSPRAYPGYPGGTEHQRYLRELLRQTMELEGFTVYEFEWWHFDYKNWQYYAIGNEPFESLATGP